MEDQIEIAPKTYKCTTCGKIQKKPFYSRKWDQTIGMWRFRIHRHCEICESEPQIIGEKRKRHSKK
jgi:hypothetical protein